MFEFVVAGLGNKIVYEQGQGLIEKLAAEAVQVAMVHRLFPLSLQRKLLCYQFAAQLFVQFLNQKHLKESNFLLEMILLSPQPALEYQIFNDYEFAEEMQ